MKPHNVTGPSPEERKLIDKVYPVSRETLERFSIMVRCIHEWQAKTNLVSPATLGTIWMRHVADSLQCIAIKPDARSWVDLGSGGGFPGLVIGAVMAERNGVKIQLVESNLKKAAFLRQTARKMDIDVLVHPERVESVAERLVDVELVTARAFAPLPKLLEYAQRLIEMGATGLFHKGKGYELELEECNGLWDFDLINHPSIVSDDSVLLEVCNLRRASV